MKNENYPSIISILRQRVEELLKIKATDGVWYISEEEMMKLLEELEKHYVELELQNKELSVARLTAQEAADKYAELYDFSPSFYFTLSRDGRITELNLSASEMIGKERKDLINIPFDNFVSDDTRPIFNHFLSRVFTSNTRETCEITLFFNEEMTPLYLQLTGISGKNDEQCLLSGADITEHKQAIDTTKRSQVFLMSSLESLKNMIIHFGDQNYRYLYFNKAHRDSMKNNYHIEIKLGMNILDCIRSEKERKIFKENYDHALRGESRSNTWISGNHGSSFYEIFFNPIMNEENAIIGVTIMSMDITDRKRVEVELEKWINMFKPKAN